MAVERSRSQLEGVRETVSGKRLSTNRGVGREHQVAKEGEGEGKMKEL